MSVRSPEKRHVQRLEQAIPVLNALVAWENKILGQQQQSLTWAEHLSIRKSNDPQLSNHLWDGRLEINRAERSRKPVMINQKNFLFANTLKGAADSAVIFICGPDRLGKPTESVPLLLDLTADNSHWYRFDKTQNTPVPSTLGSSGCAKSKFIK